MKTLTEKQKQIQDQVARYGVDYYVIVDAVPHGEQVRFTDNCGEAHTVDNSTYNSSAVNFLAFDYDAYGRIYAVVTLNTADFFRSAVYDQDDFVRASDPEQETDILARFQENYIFDSYNVIQVCDLYRRTDTDLSFSDWLDTELSADTGEGITYCIFGNEVEDWTSDHDTAIEEFKAEAAKILAAW